MTTIKILSSTFSDGLWFCTALFEDEQGTRIGPYSIDLPENSTEEELAYAIETLYYT